MTPVIKEKKGFKIVGLRYFGANENNEIPELWHNFLQRMGEVQHLGNQSHTYGVCTCMDSDSRNEDENAFEYVAGREVQGQKTFPKAWWLAKFLAGPLPSLPTKAL